MTGYVLDVSVAVTALTEPGTSAADLLVEDDAVFQAPSIFDAEVLSALRDLVRGMEFDRTAAASLIIDLMVLPVLPCDQRQRPAHPGGIMVVRVCARALTRLLPPRCERTGWSPQARSCAGTAA